ncbi:MAG: hypothetical protein JXA60_09105 [Candidatus Coatesbacteria bacterium]|nr:hypothetical protein [Candidatus Coatesbacteria bacterium]
MRYIIVLLLWISYIYAWYCPLCNFANNDNERKCRNCSFEKSDDTHFSCCKGTTGNDSNPAFRYCMDCGYDTKTGLIRRTRINDRYLYLTVSSDGSIIAYRDTTEKTIIIARLHDLSVYRKLDGQVENSEFTNPLLISPRNRYIASSAALWDIETGNAIHTFRSSYYGYSNNGTGFSRDEKFFVYSQEDSTFIIWEIASKRQIMKLKGSSPFAFSDDNKLLACTDIRNDYEIMIYDLEHDKTIKPEQNIRGEEGFWVNSYAFLPLKKILTIGMFYNADGVITNQLYIWDIGKGKNDRKLDSDVESQYGSDMGDICFSENGLLMATPSSYGVINIWDTRTWKIHKSLPGNNDNPDKLAFINNNKIATVSDYEISIWNAEQKTVQDARFLKSYWGVSIGGVNKINISDSGKYLTSSIHVYQEGSEYWDLVLWDTENDKMLKKYQEASNGDVRFFGEECYMAAVVQDTLQRIVLESAELVSGRNNVTPVFETKEGNFYNYIKILSDKKKIIMNFIGFDETTRDARIIEMASGRTLKEIPKKEVITMSPDEKYAVLRERTREPGEGIPEPTTIIDLETAREINITNIKMQNYTFWEELNMLYTYSATFSNDNHYFAYTEESDKVMLVDFTTQKTIATLKGNSPVTFSDDGQLLLVSIDEGFILYETASGKKIHTFISQSGSATCFKFLKDRSFFAGFEKGDILLFETSPVFHLLHSMTGHSTYIDSFCLTKDETRLFSAGKDGSIIIWKIK